MVQMKLGLEEDDGKRLGSISSAIVIAVKVLIKALRLSIIILWKMLKMLASVVVIVVGIVWIITTFFI